MAVAEEPILSRLDRLDNLLREAEEIRGCNIRSPKSYSSTPSSGTLTSEGQVPSSVDLSPKSLEKHCRPIHRVLIETELKGSLIARLDLVEDRVLKLCVQLEEELEAEKRREEGSERKGHKKGLKGLVNKMLKVRTNKHKAHE